MERTCILHIRLLHGKPQEITDLQEVLKGAPGYYYRVTGLPPRPTEAHNTYFSIPIEKECDKYILGFYIDDKMVGCAEILRGYPDKETTVIALFILSELHQKKGYGIEFYNLVEKYIRAWPEIKKLRLGVVVSNDIVLPFWIRHGFTDQGERKPHREGEVTSQIIVLEKFF